MSYVWLDNPLFCKQYNQDTSHYLLISRPVNILHTGPFVRTSYHRSLVLYAVPMSFPARLFLHHCGLLSTHWCRIVTWTIISPAMSHTAFSLLSDTMSLFVFSLTLMLPFHIMERLDAHVAVIFPTSRVVRKPAVSAWRHLSKLFLQLYFLQLGSPDLWEYWIHSS